MSPTPFRIPFNAKIVARHGTTSVYALRDGRLAFVDHTKNRTFFDGSRDVGTGTYGSGHNSAWADSRIVAVASKGGSASFAQTKALKPKQSRVPQEAPDQPGEEIPDEAFSRLMPMIPKEFLDWAASYEIGDPLPPMMPGYGGRTLCSKSINDTSYSQDDFGVDQVVERVLADMGLPDINPALAFAPEIETKGLPRMEQKGILGREIRDMARNIVDSILTARGLWKDELNKIRCGSGPNANRFTDIFGTGCDVPGADMAGNIVGAIRAGVDVPGPVDEVAGKIEGARESVADAADGIDVPGGKSSLGERLRMALTRVRGGHTPHYVADMPGDIDPAAGMSDVLNRRSDKRGGFLFVRSLVSRNKRRERAKKAVGRFESAEKMAREAFATREYRDWEQDFTLRKGRLPNQGEKLNWLAEHIGWKGQFRDAAGKLVTDEHGNPVGSFGGLADTAVVDGVVTDMTHFEAMVEQIVRDPRFVEGGNFDRLSEAQKRRRREEVARNIYEYGLQTLFAMKNAGGPEKIEQIQPDGSRILVDNPEHKKRFAEVIPTHFRVIHPTDPSNFRGLADAAVVTGVNSFEPGFDDEIDFVPLLGTDRRMTAGRPLTAGVQRHGRVAGSLPLYAHENQTRGGEIPFVASISLNPVWFTDRQTQKDKLKAFGGDHLGMDISREAFWAHTADHELNHVDDFAQRLGNKLGYWGELGGGREEWMRRLSQQTYTRTPTGGYWSNVIDLRKDAASYTFLGQQIAELDAKLAAATTTYERQKAIWFFYMQNMRFNERTMSDFARWMNRSGAGFTPGKRLSKAEQAAMLTEIFENLRARGYSEEHGVPTFSFWEDMMDTPLGYWDPATGKFEFPMDPRTGRLNPYPLNVMNLQPKWTGRRTPANVPFSENVATFGIELDPARFGPGRDPYGQARLDNSVSNLLHGYIGGTYAGEDDYEFAAELRTQLNKQGALADVREFLADPARNIHQLTEADFMTLVARYVGTDEVHRLYGEPVPGPRALPDGVIGPGGGAPPPPGAGGPPGGAPRGPMIPLGPGSPPRTPPDGGGGATPPPASPGSRGTATGPTIPTVPRADDPDIPTPDDTTPPPASPRLRGTATRPTIPMVPRADDPDNPTPDDTTPPPASPRLRGTATRPTIPMRPSDEGPEAPGDAPEPEAPSRVRGTGVRRPTRPTTDDDLVEPTVRPETDADRVSPERRRADADRERRVRELFGDEEDPAERERSGTRTTDSAEETSPDRPRTTASAARDELNAARKRARDRRFAEREEADKRAEEASRRMAEARYYEGVYGDVEQAVEDAKRNIPSDSRINPRDRERRVRTMDEQVAARRKALDKASAATDPKERRGQQIVAAALEAELMYKAGQIDYRTNERRQADLSVLADLNGTPLYRDDQGMFKLESSVPEWQRTEGPDSIDDSAESVASRTALAERMFGESEASELLGTRSSETDGPTADSQADRLRLNQIREERVNATARVADAETRHDEALRRARRTGSDPDRGGDGDPAAWADYRAAYEELNEADAENARLLRESRELEDRIPKSETPTPATTRDPSRRSYERPETPEGIIVEGETPQRQIRMINQTTGEIIYVDPSNARIMDEVRAEGFAPDVRQPTAPARRQASGREKPRTKPAREPDWVRRERARRDRAGLADDIPGYDDEPDVGMAPPVRRGSDSDGVREFLEEGDGAFMTPEQARLQRDGAVERRESAISQRERLINERDGVENGVVGRNLTDDQAQRRVEELNRQIADLERRIDDHERTAELFSEHARKLEEGIPIRGRRGGDAEAGMALYRPKNVVTTTNDPPTSMNPGTITSDGGFQAYTFDFATYEFDGPDGMERIIFEDPNLVNMDDPSIRVIPRNPYAITGTDELSEEGRSLARRYHLAKAGLMERNRLAGEKDQYDVDGYVDSLLYRASMGDPEAEALIAELSDLGEQIREEARARRIAKDLDDSFGEIAQSEIDGSKGAATLKALTPDKLALVHETKYEPRVLPDGTLEIQPLADFPTNPPSEGLDTIDGKPTYPNVNYPRHTVHFGVGGLAGGHVQRQSPKDIDPNQRVWVVVTNFGEAMDANPGSVETMRLEDTSLTPRAGEGLRFPPGTFRILELTGDKKADFATMNGAILEVGGTPLPADMDYSRYGGSARSRRISQMAAELGFPSVLDVDHPSSLGHRGSMRRGNFIDRREAFATALPIEESSLSMLSDNSLERISTSTHTYGGGVVRYVNDSDTYIELFPPDLQERIDQGLISKRDARRELTGRVEARRAARAQSADGPSAGMARGTSEEIFMRPDGTFDIGPDTGGRSALRPSRIDEEVVNQAVIQARQEVVSEVLDNPFATDQDFGRASQAIDLMEDAIGADAAERLRNRLARARARRDRNSPQTMPEIRPYLIRPPQYGDDSFGNRNRVGDMARAMSRPDDPRNPPRTATARLAHMDTANSSVARDITYDPQNGDLTVTYNDDRVVTFTDVPYERVRKAGFDDLPDDLISELENEQNQMRSRPIGRMSDGNRARRNVSGPRRLLSEGNFRSNERRQPPGAEQFDDGPSAGMGRTYETLVGTHANVVSRKRDELAKAQQTLDGIGTRRDKGLVTEDEAKAVASAFADLFSGDMRVQSNFEGRLRTELLSDGRTMVRLDAQVNWEEMVQVQDLTSIPITMQIKSADGKTIYGYASRRLEIGEDGITVHHGSLTISPEYRGKGIASEFNARNENLYKALGVRSITTSGSSSSVTSTNNPFEDQVIGTGATHWARNGFTWRDDDAKQKFIGIIDSALSRKPGIFSDEERQRISSLYKRGRSGDFQTSATAEELVDFEAADRLFAEEGAIIGYRRDLAPAEIAAPKPSRLTRIADRLGRRSRNRRDETDGPSFEPPPWDPDAELEEALDDRRARRIAESLAAAELPDFVRDWDPEAGMAETRRARSAAKRRNAAMARNVGPALKGDTDVKEKSVDPAPPPFSRRDSQKLTQVTADSDALNASIVQQRKALVDKYAPGRHGEPVESYADELMDSMGVARETGLKGKPMTFGEQLDQAMDFFLRTAEQDGKEDQVADPRDSLEDRDVSFMKGAAKLAALELAQTEEGRKKVREAMATAILDTLAGAEPALEKDPSLRRATTIRIHMNDRSDLRKFAGYASSEIDGDGRVGLVVSLVPNVLVFDSSLFVGSDEGPLSKGQGLSEVFRFAGSDDYHFGLGVHEYAHLEHYRSWYASLGLRVGRDAPPLSAQPKGRLGDSLIGAEISRKHNFPMDATWDEVRETFAKTLGNQWDARQLADQHNIMHISHAPSLDDSIYEIVEQISHGSKKEQLRQIRGAWSKDIGGQITDVLTPAGATNYRAQDFGAMLSALTSYERSLENPFLGMNPENLTEEQKRWVIERIKMPEKIGSKFLALEGRDGWDDEVKFLDAPAVRKIVNDVLEGQTPEEFLAEHKRIMDQVLGYDSGFASTLGVPTDEVMRVLGRSSLYGQTNIMEAVAEARVVTLYAERFRESLSIKQLEQVEEMREMLERVLPDPSGGVAVRNLTPEAKEHFARLARMLGKLPILKLDPEALKAALRA